MNFIIYIGFGSTILQVLSYYSNHYLFLFNFQHYLMQSWEVQATYTL